MLQWHLRLVGEVLELDGERLGRDEKVLRLLRAFLMWPHVGDLLCLSRGNFRR